MCVPSIDLTGLTLPPPFGILDIGIVKMTTAEPTAPDYKSPEETFEALENYEWDKDAEFQTGLSSILSSASSPEQAEALALRARCFYFARLALCPRCLNYESDLSQKIKNPN